MTTRFARRLGVVATGIFVSVAVAAGPALAGTKPDDGEGHQTHDLSALGVFVRFVLIPIGIFVVVGGLAALPSALSKPRYRPGKPWDHDGLVVGAPGSAGTASAGTTDGDTTARGGASAEW